MPNTFTQLDSSKQKTKLIQLTGATATSTSPNKPSDKTKQHYLLHHQNKTWQWQHIKLNFLPLALCPSGTSLFGVWISYVNSSVLPPFLLSLSLSLAQSPVSSSMWLTAQICGHDLYLRGWLWVVRPWAVELWSSHRYSHTNKHTAPGYLFTDN